MLLRSGIRRRYVDCLCHVNDINVNVNVVKSGGCRA